MYSVLVCKFFNLAQLQYNAFYLCKHYISKFSVSYIMKSVDVCKQKGQKNLRRLRASEVLV